MSSDAASETSRSKTLVRWILAGPVALIGAIVAMAVTPLWMPQGAGGVDHLAFAIILFPLYWAALFFYAVLAERLGRAALVFGALFGISAYLLWQAFAN